MVKRPTTAEAIRLNRLCLFGHEQRMEENSSPPQKTFKDEFGNNKLRGRPRSRRQDEVRKDGRLVWRVVWKKRKSTQQRRMEQAPENGNESPHSAHANE